MIRSLIPALVLLGSVPAIAQDDILLRTQFDKLPFKFFFEAPDSNFGGRSGRLGRPLKPNDSMDFSPNREPWEKGRGQGYPGPKLGITIPF